MTAYQLGAAELGSAAALVPRAPQAAQRGLCVCAFVTYEIVWRAAEGPGASVADFLGETKIGQLRGEEGVQRKEIGNKAKMCRQGERIGTSSGLGTASARSVTRNVRVPTC